jgi:hypothetical protein
MPDEQGRYHFDEMGYKNPPEYPGYLIGSLSGLLAPQEAEHKTAPLPMTALQEA